MSRTCLSLVVVVVAVCVWEGEGRGLYTSTGLVAVGQPFFTGCIHACAWSRHAYVKELVKTTTNTTKRVPHINCRVNLAGRF